MPETENLDAVGLERPEGFVDFAFAITYSTMIEKFYDIGFDTGNKQSALGSTVIRKQLFTVTVLFYPNSLAVPVTVSFRPLLHWTPG